MTVRSSIRGILAAFVAIAIALAVLPVIRTTTAQAAPTGGLPTPPSAEPLPTVQIDGVAWQQVVYGNTVYVGGLFNTARPAGAAPGTNTVARVNMLAYNITTGELITKFVADTNAQVMGMAMAPDGSKLYIAGEFTKVNGIDRLRIAALDPVTGAVDTAFNAGTDFRIRGLLVTSDTVYAGGRFNVANNQPRTNLAAFRRSDGAVLNWAPQANNGQVMALAQVPGSDLIAVAGSFNELNSTSALGLGAVSPATGGTLAFPANQIIKNGTDGKSAIYSLSSDTSKIYGTGYTYGNGGNFEGTFATDATGNIAWINDSRGDQYDIVTRRGITFAAGHAHRDTNVENGFQELNNNTPMLNWPVLAMTADATGTLAPATVSFMFGGQPAPTLLHWFPNLTFGTFTGEGQAGWTVDGNDQYIVLGGEFPSVGSVAQQGLVRFAFRDVKPNTIRPVSSGPNFKADVTSPASGVAQISWLANWDRDDPTLTYTVERQGTGAIATFSVRSTYYERPVTTHLDTGRSPGSTLSYRVVARDSSGNVATGDWVPVTVNGSGALSKYAAAVLADSPSIHYRFEESAGSVIDTSYTSNGAASGSVTRSVAGAIAQESGNAYRFSGGSVASAPKQPNPRAMSTEAWIKTNSNQGGLIVGFGDSATGSSSTLDYATYLGKDGKVRFVVDERGKKELTGPVVNDGTWHHVISTLDWASGQRLYVDGQLVDSDATVRHARDYAGYWRIGSDSLAGQPDRPTSDALNADIDEVALYTTAMSPQRVKAHFDAGKGQAVANQAPTASFTSAVNGLQVSADASGSSDPDGSIAAYSWTFGDGFTTTGASAVHAYSEAGSYPVTLTVTDNEGLTGSKSATVTVTASASPATLVSDTFDRTTSAGWGVAPTGGAWTVTGGASNFAVDGTQASTAIAVGTTRRATATAVGSNVELSTVVSLDSVPTGGGLYLSLGTRSANGNALLTRLRFYSDGKVGLHNQRLVGGTVTTVGGKDLPNLTYTPGAKLNVRVNVAGSGTATVSAKVWKVGTAEPSAWDVVTTDATSTLQGSGTFYVEPFLSGSATSPVVMRMDSFAATSGGGANQPPVASFTVSASGLQAAVNGSGSSDPDGSIASYAWTFGDGGTATGATASHTYASAGTYPVTLTVTDGSGAKGTMSAQVSVSATGSPGVLLADDFTRSVTSGWGVAPTGGAWTVTGGASNFGVSATEATASATPGTTRRATSAASGANLDLRTSVSLNSVPTGGGLYTSIGTRSSGGNAYLTRLRFYSDGKVGLHNQRLVGGVVTTIGGKDLPGLTYAVGDTLNVRLQVSGSTISAKVWKGATEPAAWDVVTTDTTLSASGGLFIENYLSASATAPVVVRLDSIKAESLG